MSKENLTNGTCDNFPKQSQRLAIRLASIVRDPDLDPEAREILKNTVGELAEKEFITHDQVKLAIGD